MPLFDVDGEVLFHMKSDQSDIIGLSMGHLLVASNKEIRQHKRGQRCQTHVEKTGLHKTVTEAIYSAHLK